MSTQIYRVTPIVVIYKHQTGKLIYISCVRHFVYILQGTVPCIIAFFSESLSPHEISFIVVLVYLSFRKILRSPCFYYLWLIWPLVASC
jgi:hypothetical protein